MLCTNMLLVMIVIEALNDDTCLVIDLCSEINSPHVVLFFDEILLLRNQVSSIEDVFMLMLFLGVHILSFPLKASLLI